jgi:hypothetical protein
MMKVNLLWLDDDLRSRADGYTAERARLQAWLRWFKSGDRPARVNVIEVRDLLTFRRELMARAGKPAGDPDAIDALLIDIFWRAPGLPGNWTFEELDPGFSRETVLPLEAGAQLIGLMRNEGHRQRRPTWLDAFAHHPLAVLTTLTDHREPLERHVDPQVLSGIKVLVKAVVVQGQVEPDRGFCDWVGQLRRHVPEPLAAHP